MSKKNVIVGARLFFGLLVSVALGVQLAIHVSHGFSVINFFSYFTNLSNIFAAAVLLVGAVRLSKGRQPSRLDDLVRGASTVAIVLVGIVYGILLRGEDLGSLLPWVNVVIHYVSPVVLLADWLYQPPKTKLYFRHVLYWLAYPCVYFVYSLGRGAATGWYAYPFFNPSKVGGYTGVTLDCLGILGAFLLVGWLLVIASRTFKRHA